MRTDTGSCWRARTRMPSRRHDHACYAIDDELVVISGFDDATNYDETLAYDPEIDEWRGTRSPIPTARGLFGSCRLDGGLYVVAGKRLRPGFVETGEPPQYDVFDALERYDPDADEWTAYAPAPTTRAGLGAAAIDDHLYAIGGTVCEDPVAFPGSEFITDRVEVYDPAADAWSPGPPLPAARTDPIVERVGDRVLVAGGSVDGTVRDDVFVLGS